MVKAPGTDTYVSFSRVRDKLEDVEGRRGGGQTILKFKSSFHNILDSYNIELI